MKNKIINFVMFFIIIFIIFINTQNKYIFIIMNIYIFLYTYYLIKEYIQQKEEEEYVEKKFNVVKKNILDIEDLIILILKNNKIIWANENAYEKFPHLKNDRSSNFLKKEDGLIKYDNKIYKIIENSELDDIYILMDYTDSYRLQSKLSNIQTIIGHFQIDNLSSLEKTMTEIEYLDFTSSFEKTLYSIFVDNKINFLKISEDSYYLNFPYRYIEEGINNRFKEIGDLIRDFHDQGIDVTTTMGIAYNYPDVDKTGRKAKEAFELALSRGGGQIVIFENENKLYFGGGISSSKGSHRLRARIIGNTISRIIPGKEVVYLITHKDPDADGIGSILLFYEYLKTFEISIKVLLDKEENIKKFDLEKLPIYKDIIYHYVIDKTKKNILISLDTQSKDIISHPNILDELEEKIIIDHHQTPQNYFRGNLFSWIEPNASSTTELVESILLTKDIRIKNEEVNTLAILGILTDTNKLKYRTSYQTIDALMHLVEAGGDLNTAFEKLFIKKEEFIIKQKILSQVTFIEDFSYVEVDYEVDNIIHSTIADDMLQVIGIKGAIAICKTGDKYSIKIRTTNAINAKNLIEPYSGGGHYKQAAAILTKEQKEQFLEQIKNKDY